MGEGGEEIPDPLPAPSLLCHRKKIRGGATPPHHPFGLDTFPYKPVEDPRLRKKERKALDPSPPREATRALPQGAPRGTTG